PEEMEAFLKECAAERTSGRVDEWTSGRPDERTHQSGSSSRPLVHSATRPPSAYDRAVDRLLASPAYGERWARHWLDVVRYGESNGYEQNHLRPNAWPYRD